MHRVRVLLGLPLVVLLGLAAVNAAAASAQAPAYPEILIKATDYHFDAPAQIAGGLVRLTLENAGHETHHAMVLRLNPGKTPADLQAALQQGLAGLAAVASSVGGPGSIDPGQRSSVVLDLQAGVYALICLVPDASGVPHAAKGMVMPLTVTAAGAAQPAPTAETTVDLADFMFAGLPAKVASGPQVWRVSNQGPQPHELGIVKLAPGITPDMLPTMLAAPPATPGATPVPASPVAGPPILSVGGMAPMSPGTSGWVMLDLQPGTYVAICFIPDATTGKPHFALGMVMPFTVDG